MHSQRTVLINTATNSESISTQAMDTREDQATHPLSLAPTEAGRLEPESAAPAKKSKKRSRSEMESADEDEIDRVSKSAKLEEAPKDPSPGAAPPADQKAAAVEQKEEAPPAALKIKKTAGKHQRSPLSWQDLNTLIASHADKSFYERLKGVILEHANVKKSQDQFTQLLNYERDGRKLRMSLTYETQTYTQYIDYQKSLSEVYPIKVTITPRKIFHQKQSLTDTNNSSWIDEEDESDADVYFDIRAYQGAFDRENQCILRLSVRKDTLDAELAKELPTFVEPGAGAVEEKKSAENSVSEIHTIHAGFGKNTTSGTDAVKIGLLFNSLFARNKTQLVDDSKFECENGFIPLRLFFPIIYGKTYYERLISGMHLTEGEIKTAYNGVLNQSAERRAVKLKQFHNKEHPEQEFTLQQWHEALQEQKQLVCKILNKEKKSLLDTLFNCAELKSFVTKTTRAAILDDPRLAVEMLKLYNNDVELERRLRKQNNSDEFKESPLVKQYYAYIQYLRDMEYPDLLLNLTRKFFPSRLNPGPGSLFIGANLTIRQLVEEVSKASKSSISADFLLLKELLCDGVKDIDKDGSGNFYTKSFDPSQKIAPIREAVCELMWASYIWEFDPSVASLVEKSTNALQTHTARSRRRV